MAITAPLRVMIATSDPEDGERIVELLAKLRPKPRCFTGVLDGHAVDRIRYWRPDILVVDWGEPAVNAFELSLALRCWSELSSLRVLALCDDGGGLRDSCVVTLQKPVAADALRRSMLELLGERGAPSPGIALPAG